jgi:hypothetical protein
MQKLTVVVLAVVFAGTASAEGWRSLRLDASSETALKESVALFRDKLSPRREYVFDEALKDIWNEVAKAAESEQREYTADEFYRQLDGLRYEEVVTLTDPTGDTAKKRYRNAPEFYRQYRSRYVPTYNPPPYIPPIEANRMPGYPEVPHGGTDLGGSGQK